MRAKLRPAAVAGQFYPSDPANLRQTVSAFVAPVESADSSVEPLKAIIVPHAAYDYSGSIAGKAYAQLRPLDGVVRRVVLLGPSHYVPFPGLATCSACAFETPLGEVSVDVATVEQLLQLPQVSLLDEANAFEHSLEVQLPFLQVVLHDFEIVPVTIGQAAAEGVAELIETTWDGQETLIIVSSDLSHFHDYETAQRMDSKTSVQIEALQHDRIDRESACGHRGIRGLLIAARRHGLTAKTIALSNSGNTTGRRDSVVGYGAFAFADR